MRAQARLLVVGADALDAAISDVHAQAAREVGAERSSILLFDVSGHGTLDRSWAVPGTVAPRFTRLDIPWAARELRAGRSIVFTRLSELPAHAVQERRSLAESHIRSGILIPLRSASAQVLGWIGFVTLEQEHAWTATQVQVAERYGALLAAALMRLRAERERDEELRAHVLLAEVSHAFLALPPERAVEGLSATLRLVARYLGASRGSAWELAGDGQSVLLLAQWRDGASALPAQAPMASPALGSLLREHLRRNEAWHVPSLDALPPGSEEERARLEAWGVGSFLMVPLRTGACELGWLSFSKPVPAPWAQHLVHRIERVGDLVSAALLRARDSEQVRAAKREAEATRALMQATLDALSAQVALADETGRILAANEAWRRAQPGSLNCLDVCRLASGEAPGTALIPQGVERMLRGELRELRLAYPCETLGGGLWYQLRVTHFVHEGERRLVFAHEDVTELKQAEEQLRELAGELLQVQDAERRRIASVLHDGAAQQVFAGVMGVRSAQRLQHPASEELAQSREVLEDALLQLRTLSHLLHPPLLDEAGLGAALRAYLDGVSTRSGLALTLEGVEGLERLAPESEHALFRVVQEALLNVQRHSGSARAHVRLEQDAAELRVSVRDEGRGFSAATRCSRPTVGLASMRQRLLQVGGTLEVRSGPGGTEVRARVPRTRE